jgi:diguanylate cyclase (GGDEF)-like protein
VLAKSTQLDINTSNRTLLAVLGVTAYALLCLGLARQGPLQVAALTYDALLAVWFLGFVALLFADRLPDRLDVGTLALYRVLWCNLGVVVTAVLVPHVLRIVLLVVPMFGLLYAALRLDRKQMIAIGLITWAAYLVGAGMLVLFGSADPLFEGLLALAFTCVLAAMLIMAAEVTTLRRAFERRRDRLNEAVEQLAEIAMRDELTGLYNRRYIMDVLGRQKALADRGHLSFTLCYCDLDHFKRINDRYGHHIGDQVLSDFARVAGSVVRSVDFVARLGGEEFLLVLVGADEETACQVAGRLCEQTKIAEMIPDEPDYRLTVSVGVATFRRTERIEDVIQRADRALYEAKSQGRDAIVLGS